MTLKTIRYSVGMCSEAGCAITGHLEMCGVCEAQEQDDWERWTQSIDDPEYGTTPQPPAEPSAAPEVPE